MERFGEKLRILRNQHELTQKQLGEILGVNRTHVTRLENGEKTPNAAMIIKIARFFNVTADQMMMDDQDLD